MAARPTDEGQRRLMRMAIVAGMYEPNEHSAHRSPQLPAGCRAPRWRWPAPSDSKLFPITDQVGRWQMMVNRSPSECLLDDWAKAAVKHDVGTTHDQTWRHPPVHDVPQGLCRPWRQCAGSEPVTRIGVADWKGTDGVEVVACAPAFHRTSHIMGRESSITCPTTLR